MTRQLYLVNASPLLTDADVAALVGPIQTQIDRDFMPAWGHGVEPVTVLFAGAADIPDLPDDSWPIFLNRHSTDPGALGWHDFDNRAYSRCFVGDCLVAGLDWHVTVSHEVLELLLDPDIRRVYRMPDGGLAAYEACDAVEADELAYDIGGVKVSDFVLPSYFSVSRQPPFDFRSHLTGPCPVLTPGGYMSVADAHGNWTQVTRDRGNGLAGRRALARGFRRQMRIRPLDQLDIIG